MKWIIAALALAITLSGASSISSVLAFPHAHMTITPTEENANPISVVIGHSDEPAYGFDGELHQGRHDVELFLEDASTALPLSGARLSVDKYFFDGIESFNAAGSVNDATQVEANATLGSVFGEQGHYTARQIVTDGIYGYRVYGTIDYFGVAEVPINATIFCNSSEGNTTKFNSEGWGGGFGCPEDISDLRFPSLDQQGSPSVVQPSAAVSGGEQYQMLSLGLAGAGLAAFLGIRHLRKDPRD
jgi:hypothetical protein